MDNPDSRYRRLDILESVDKIKFFETQEKIEIPPSSDDKYHEVEHGEENRLDKIANRYYKNSTLWWVIAYVNNIKDPFYIKKGVVLRIPSENKLYGFKGLIH